MTTLIDPKAGAHFTGKIFVTPHACDEAAKDFGVDRSKAPMYVMDQLRRASFIADIVNEDGRPSRLFGYKRMAIVVAPDTATVITVYPRHQANSGVSETVQKALLRALKSANRKEKLAEKRINIAIAQLNVELANCELKKARSESLNVIGAMKQRQADVRRAISELERELLAIKREKTTLANDIVMYL